MTQDWPRTDYRMKHKNNTADSIDSIDSQEEYFSDYFDNVELVDPEKTRQHQKKRVRIKSRKNYGYQTQSFGDIGTVSYTYRGDPYQSQRDPYQAQESGYYEDNVVAEGRSQFATRTEDERENKKNNSNKSRKTARESKKDDSVQQAKDGGKEDNKESSWPSSNFRQRFYSRHVRPFAVNS